jgi:hypothetical protein
MFQEQVLLESARFQHMGKVGTGWIWLEVWTFGLSSCGLEVRTVISPEPLRAPS